MENDEHLAQGLASEFELFLNQHLQAIATARATRDVGALHAGGADPDSRPHPGEPLQL